MPDAVGPIDATSSNRISSRELQLLAQSRSKPKFAALSSEERGAYSRIQAVLERRGAVAVDALGGPGEFAAKLTSGFHPGSGVRGSLPKDLPSAGLPLRGTARPPGHSDVAWILLRKSTSEEQPRRG